MFKVTCVLDKCHIMLIEGLISTCLCSLIKILWCWPTYGLFWTTKPVCYYIISPVNLLSSAEHSPCWKEILKVFQTYDMVAAKDEKFEVGGDYNYSIILAVITGSEGNLSYLIAQYKKNWTVVVCFDTILETMKSEKEKFLINPSVFGARIKSPKRKILSSCTDIHVLW